MDVIETDEGGLLIVGSAFGAGRQDVYLARLDSAGQVVWEKTYGGADEDCGWSVVKCHDGSYAIAGCTRSFGVEQRSLYLIKVDSDGSMQWQKIYENVDGWSSDILECEDGGFIVSGTLFARDNSPSQVCIIRTDASGGKIWRRTYGNGNPAMACSIVPCTSGGYVIAGSEMLPGVSPDLSVKKIPSPLPNWSWRAYLIKIDGDGDKVWDGRYGPEEGCWINDMVQTEDGGFAATGSTPGPKGRGMMYVIKIDAEGREVWQKAFGKRKTTWGTRLVSAPDGGLIAGGRVARSHGGDSYLLKLDSDGHRVWEQVLQIFESEQSSDHAEGVSSLLRRRDGSYILGIDGDTGRICLLSFEDSKLLERQTAFLGIAVAALLLALGGVMARFTSKSPRTHFQ